MKTLHYGPKFASQIPGPISLTQGCHISIAYYIVCSNIVVIEEKNNPKNKECTFVIYTLSNKESRNDTTTSDCLQWVSNHNIYEVHDRTDRTPNAMIKEKPIFSLHGSKLA